MFDGEARSFLKNRSLNGDVLVADCTPDERIRLADTQLELFCLPIGLYIDTTLVIPQDRDCKGLVLVTHSNQPWGYYQRWGIFRVT